MSPHSLERRLSDGMLMPDKCKDQHSRDAEDMTVREGGCQDIIIIHLLYYMSTLVSPRFNLFFLLFTIATFRSNKFEFEWEMLIHNCSAEYAGFKIILSATYLMEAAIILVSN
jgi:hypothetical protein